jgi:catechol 2,3-dioxygenase-like lactoylglutathione lyase family enzyme
MSDRPVFDQINLVVSDMDAAIAFYRRLGVDLDVPTGDWPPGSGAHHVNAGDEEGAHFDLDDVPMARLWGDDALAAGTTVVGFRLASRDAVDETYAELVAAGYKGQTAPYDAFFGARYAVVEDPDARPVGLMSPIDPAKKYVPSVSG